jgi:hypothetical protein
MRELAVFVVAQAALTFGLAGLFWPEKFSVLFDFLMFPWPSGNRTVRANSIGALALSAVVVLALLFRLS